MYIYDTGEGYEVYVLDITDNMVKATTSMPDSRVKLSLIKYDRYDKPYFIKNRHKIYLSELQEFEGEDG